MAKAIEKLSDDELMDVRLADLKLSFRGSEVEREARRLSSTLQERGLKLKPYFWISTSFFVPDGCAGVALPFYLFHPRLLKLEKKMVGEAEGSSAQSFAKLVRH